MKIKMSEKNKYYLIAFLLGALIFTIVFLPFAARNNMIFYLHSDFNAQQIPFTIYLQQNLRNLSIPQYDFYAGTGLDFIEAYGFYNLFSPFMLLHAVFSSEWTIYLIPFIIALKFGFCSLFTYIYALRFCKNKDYALIAGLLYTFSGYQMVNFVFHYLDALVFFPLLLYTLELAVVEKKRACFGITAAICAFTNYYIFGTEVVFLVLYFVCRLTDESFRISLKDFFCLAAESILAVLAAGIVLLPALSSLLNSPRYDAGFSNIFEMLIYETPWRYARILQAIFLPPDVLGYTNFFPDVADAYPRGSCFSSQALYIPLFGISGVTAYIAANKKSWFAKLTIACCVTAFIPVLNSLFSFGSPLYYARWMFAPTLIMAVMTACALENEPKYFKHGLIIHGAAIAAIAVFSVLFPIKKLAEWKIMYFNTIQGVAQIVIGTVGLIIAAALLFKIARDNMYSKTVLVIVTAFALAFCEITVLFQTSDTIDHTAVISARTDYPEIDKTKYGSRVTDDEYFDNCNLFNKQYSLYSFNSTVNPYFVKYCDAVGELTGNIQQYYEAICLCSVKTFIFSKEVSKGGALPFGGDYEYIRNGTSCTLYENKNFIPIGFCYDYFITNETLMSLDEDIRGEIMLRAMVVDEESCAEGYLVEADESMLYDLSDEEFAAECALRAETAAESFTSDDDSCTAVITTDAPELVFFSFAYDEDFTAYVDGEKAEIINANVGFMAVPVDKGTHTIELVYHSTVRTAGTIMSIVGITGLAVYTVICLVIRRKKNKVDIV